MWLVSINGLWKRDKGATAAVRARVDLFFFFLPDMFFWLPAAAPPYGSRGGRPSGFESPLVLTKWVVGGRVNPFPTDNPNESYNVKQTGG